jgi:hypothetical protein
MKNRKKIDFESNSLYANSKYAGMNMYMTDKEDHELVEDTISRQKEEENRAQQGWRNQAKRLEDLDAPQSLIDYAIGRSKMTYLEDKEYRLEGERLQREENLEFLKNNPPKKEIIERLYNRFDEVKHNLIHAPASRVCFNKDALDPLDGILTSEEFQSIQYDAILELLFLEYQNIHREAIKKMYGVYDDYFEYVEGVDYDLHHDHNGLHRE